MEKRVLGEHESDFYASAGPMTAFGPSPMLAGLPADAESLCQLTKKLIVHEFMASAYGVTGVEQRFEELENRTVEEILAALDRLDPGRPLVEGRPPERRLLGNCRQFVVLTCALLRHAGHPARARAGFAMYLDETPVDHWVVERWDAGRGRWVQSDPQLDEEFRKEIDFRFDPLDLPEGQFVTGGEAWLRCRAGEDDPGRYGVEGLRGMWIVQGDVIRDLAALNKVELTPWDVWGGMVGPDEEIGDELGALIDEVARVTVDGGLDDLRKLYRHESLRVPAEIFSARFVRNVKLPTLTG